MRLRSLSREKDTRRNAEITQRKNQDSPVGNFSGVGICELGGGVDYRMSGHYVQEHAKEKNRGDGVTKAQKGENILHLALV